MTSRKPTETGAGAHRPVTIKDLSRQLGLSITTISRALNGYPDVGEATRKRIEEAAQASGYRPNRSAQRLVTRRSHALGWIKEDATRVFVDPHFSEVFAGVLRSSQQRTYDLVFATGTPEEQVPVYDRYFRNRSVDGFILDLPRPVDSRVNYLLEANVPFVVHGRTHGPPNYGWVDIDNRGLFRAMTAVLLANGHRNIAFINGDEHFTYASERRIGVEEALDEHGVARDAVTILTSTHPMGLTGYQLTEQALEDAACTAILYSSSIMAVEGNAALVRAGRVAGKSIEVATMDDGLRYTDLEPYRDRFSLIRSSLRDAGQALVAELVSQIETQAAPGGTMMHSEIVLRDGLDGGSLPKAMQPRKTVREDA